MKTNIQQLLSSLSGSEKRYVHLNLKTFAGEDNMNLNDFLALEKSTGKKKKEKVTQGNVTRLYYKLLDILSQYHEENLHINNIDYINLNRAKLLYHKGFHEEAKKFINKILDNPYGSNHLIKIEAIELTLINAINTGEVDYLSHQFEKDKERLRIISEEYTNLINYELLWAASKYETSSGYFFNNTSTFSEKQHQNYLSDESNAKSPMAKILFHKIKGYEAIKAQNINAAFEHTIKAIHIFQSNPDLIKANTIEYLKSIRNYAITLNFRGQYKEALAYINAKEQQLEKSILLKSQQIKIESYIVFVMMKMDSLICSESMNEQSEEFKSFEKSYNELIDILPEDEAITSSFHFAIFYLNSTTPRKAIKFINYVLKRVRNARKDILHLVLISELVTHFRLGNIDLLESKLKFYKKHIEKNGSFFSFENQLPVQFQKIINNPEDKNNYDALVELSVKGFIADKKEFYIKYNPLLHLRK